MLVTNSSWSRDLYFILTEPPLLWVWLIDTSNPSFSDNFFSRSNVSGSLSLSFLTIGFLLLTRALVKSKKPIVKKLKLKDPDTLDLEKKLSEKLGLDVSINHTHKRGGSVKIKYRSLDQLELVTSKLKS